MATSKPELTHAALVAKIYYDDTTGQFFSRKVQGGVEVRKATGSLHWRGYMTVYVYGKAYLEAKREHHPGCTL